MKLLLVTCRYPWPPRRGDQARAAQFVEFLRRDHELTLLAPEPGRGQEAPPEGVSVETYRRSRLPEPAAVLRVATGASSFQEPLFQHRDLRRKLRRLAPRADLVLLQLVRLAGLVEDLGGTPFAVDLIDALSLTFRRRARLDRGCLRPLLRAEARRLERAEARLLDGARLGWVVCRRDREALAKVLPAEALSKVQVLPLAVPSGPPEDPSASSGPGGPAEAEGPRLAMTGNLGYFPAVEGFGWWLEEVWPRLRARRPDLEVVLAGARPARRLRRLARGEGVRLIEAPRDLRRILAGSTVALAPLRSGSGQPIKILEAWGCGVPVVASPWAAAGTPAAEGVELLEAGSPEDWERKILHLLDRPDERRRLVKEGRRCLEEIYSRQAVREELLSSLAHPHLVQTS